MTFRLGLSIFCSQIVFAVIASPAQAQNLSPLAHFSRCYAHLTGRPLPLNHVSRAPLLNGTLSSDKACQDLFDKAGLDNTTSKIPVDNEAKLILNNLYEFHRSWFDTGTFEQMQAYVQNFGSYNVLDSSEPALVVTYALFANSKERYEKVLTYPHGFVALRELDPTLNTRFYASTHTLPIRRLSNKRTSIYAEPDISFRTTSTFDAANYATSTIKRMTPIQIGELVGVKPQDNVENVANYWPGISRISGTASKTENATGTSGMAVNFNFFESLGGGVLGLQSHMLLNWGHEIGLVTDGSLKLPRRWIVNSMKSMLCTELPALRETDAVPYLDTSDDVNVAPFRQGNGCVQCHATMDQMASVGRNYLVSQTDFASRVNADPATGVAPQSSYILGRFTPTIMGNDLWSSTPVANYHKSQPRGRVFFRSATGQLWNQPTNSISEVGSVLSRTDDLFLCATKRYFQYFTGINVPLYDRGDPRFAAQTSSMTSEGLKARQFIEKLARDFKNDPDQSLRKVIKEIMSSPYYKTSNFRLGGGNQ